MKRTVQMIENVYESITSERVYQDRKWGKISEHPHEVGGWLTIMRVIMANAEAAWACNDGDYKAMVEIRKLLAVGVACSEQHGLPARSHTQPISEDMRNYHS